jgi:para-nitrobenzyl esterase
LAAGLFTAAIIESGPCSLLGHALPAAEAAGRQFATTAGCAGQPDVPACLRSRPVAAILDAMQSLPAEGTDTPWAPTFATPVLPVDPTAAIASGAYHRVPTVAGTNLDEGTVFVAFIEAEGTPINAQTYPVVLSQMFGAGAARVQAEYPASAYGGDYRLALSAVYTDYLFACPTWALNRSLARASRTYAYEFADRTAPNLYAITPDFPLGAYHGAELAYLFGAGAALDPAQRRLSARMRSYWTRFAAVRDPNSSRAPHWQRFRPDHPTVLTLDRTGVSNRSGFDVRHHCGFWSTVHA